MSVIFNMKPTSVIKANLGLNQDGKVNKFFVNRVAQRMDRYVPIRDGNLRKYVIDGNYIIYNQKYAHYMYIGEIYGPNIPIYKDGEIVRWLSPKTKHPTGRPIDYSQSIARGHEFAGPYWDKRMWSAEKDELIKEVQKFIDKGGN